MSRSTRTALMLALILSGALVQAQEKPPTIRVDVNLVSLDAIVLGPDDRPVLDLQMQDFTVYDDGEVRQISHFSSTDTPSNLQLLLQNTCDYDLGLTLAEAANSFLGAQRKGDRVSLAAFDIEGYTNLLNNWERKTSGFSEEIRVPRSRGGQQGQLYSSIALALEEATKTNGRKGIIVFTDGRDSNFFEDILKNGRVPDSSADKEFQRVLKAVQTSRTPIYFVAVNLAPDSPPPPTIQDAVQVQVTVTRPGRPGPEGLPGSIRTSSVKVTGCPRPPFFKFGDSAWKIPLWTQAQSAVRSRLEELASVSGGRVVYIDDAGKLSSQIQQIVRELGSSYSIGFASARPRADGAARHIEIRVRRDGLRTVQSRETYFPK